MAGAPGQAPGPADDDPRWLRVALSLAARRLGQVAPNPAVGAVIVKDGQVLGRGVTGIGGRPHAEAMALEEARTKYGPARLAGATVHISLEPCAHHGRTPPCADALIAAGIRRVVSTIEDPDPRVAGRGFARLREAGVEVRTDALPDAANCLNCGFLTRIRRDRPWVTLKIATTLDGRIATRTGESRWITGAAARKRVHLMRAQNDAILIGAGTARADDPMLDVRGFGARAHQPVRIVADSGLSLPLTARLVQTARAQPLWLLHRGAVDAKRRQAFAETGAEPLETPEDAHGRLEVDAALALLAGRGITRLLCEGGGQISAALLAAGLVDRLVLFQAGKTFGGDGLASIAGFGLDTIADAPTLALRQSEVIEGDVMSIWERPG